MQSNAWGKWGAVHRASEGTVSSAECPDPSPGGHVSVPVLLQWSVLEPCGPTGGRGSRLTCLRGLDARGPSCARTARGPLGTGTQDSWPHMGWEAALTSTVSRQREEGRHTG